MITFRPALLGLAILAHSNAPCVSQSTPRAKAAECTITQESYSVYSALLSDRGLPEDPEESWRDKPDLIISDTTTGTGGFFKEHKGAWPWGFRSRTRQKPTDETQRNFDSHLHEICPLNRSIEWASGYILVSKKEVEDLFKKQTDGWTAFYNKYPQSSGIWSFSQVGYNAARTEALVYVSHSCGWLCGTGHLYLLSKENGKWVVKNRLMLWIS